MGEKGLQDLRNPAEGILRTTPQIGSALTIALE